MAKEVLRSRGWSRGGTAADAVDRLYLMSLELGTEIYAGAAASADVDVEWYMYRYHIHTEPRSVPTKQALRNAYSAMMQAAVSPLRQRSMNLQQPLSDPQPPQGPPRQPGRLWQPQSGLPRWRPGQAAFPQPRRCGLDACWHQCGLSLRFDEGVGRIRGATRAPQPSPVSASADRLKYWRYKCRHGEVLIQSPV